MRVYTNQESLSSALRPYREDQSKIGFVPTMGALHHGHLSLVSQALSANEVVVVSIFVNPTQFDNPVDLQKYPRTLKNDMDLLKTLDGDIIIFAPEAKTLYKGSIRSKKYRFSGLEFEMEGKHRDGHFDGVGTVLNLLFRAVQPHTAYFGEKDFQQLQIVKKLVEIEKLNITINGCAIVREENGLAMSSRNKRLTKKQFEEAAIIHSTLLEVKQKFNSLSISKLNQLVQDRFRENEHLELEYFEIAKQDTLKTAKRKHKNNTYRGFIASYAGAVRLIDNMALN